MLFNASIFLLFPTAFAEARKASPGQVTVNSELTVTCIPRIEPVRFENVTFRFANRKVTLGESKG